MYFWYKYILPKMSTILEEFAWMACHSTSSGNCFWPWLQVNSISPWFPWMSLLSWCSKSMKCLSSCVFVCCVFVFDLVFSIFFKSSNLKYLQMQLHPLMGVVRYVYVLTYSPLVCIHCTYRYIDTHWPILPLLCEAMSKWCIHHKVSESRPPQNQHGDTTAGLVTTGNIHLVSWQACGIETFAQPNKVSKSCGH